MGRAADPHGPAHGAPALGSTAQSIVRRCGDLDAPVIAHSPQVSAFARSGKVAER